MVTCALQRTCLSQERTRHLASARATMPTHLPSCQRTCCRDSAHASAIAGVMRGAIPNEKRHAAHSPRMITDGRRPIPPSHRAASCCPPPPFPHTQTHTHLPLTAHQDAALVELDRMQSQGLEPKPAHYTPAIKAWARTGDGDGARAFMLRCIDAFRGTRPSVESFNALLAGTVANLKLRECVGDG